MKKLITIEDATSLDGFVVYAGTLLPFLWTHLVVYPNEKAAKKAAGKDLRIVPVNEAFILETYYPFQQAKAAQRVAWNPNFPREERVRR